MGDPSARYRWAVSSPGVIEDFLVTRHDRHIQPAGSGDDETVGRVIVKGFGEEMGTHHHLG